MNRPPAYRVQHQRRVVAVEALERRRLLANTPLVQFSSPTYVTDAVPALQIAGSYAYITISEAGGSLTPGTVDYATGGGTATPGVDYQSYQGTVTLDDNNAYSQQVSIPIIDHGPSSAPTRTFGLTLINPTGGLAVGNPGSAMVTINEPTAVTPTAMTLSPSSNPANLGAPVVFTAFVTRTILGTGDPTGTVTFRVDGVAQPPVAVQPASASLPVSKLYDQATAQFTTTSLGTGPHTITASYSGDSTATASTGSLAETVGQASTTTLVTQSASAAAFGQPIVFTAIVTAANPAVGTPTGTVTFNIDQFVTLLPSPPPNPPEPEPIEATATVALVPSATPGQAVAQFTIATLTRSIDHPVNVTYHGDTKFTTSVGYGGVLVGNGTTTALGASATSTVANQPVTFTAAVTTTGPASELTGNVTFSIDNVAQAPIPITPSTTSTIQATAQFTSAPLAAGPHLITAVYSGNVTTAGSTTITGETIGSTSPTVVVAAGSATQPTGPSTLIAPTLTNVNASPDVPVVGRPYVLIATVAGAAPLSTAPPTGSAEFFDAGTLVAILPLDANGQAALFLPSLSKGPHAFTVVYGGDANDGISLGVVPPSILGVQRLAGNTAALVLSIGGGPLDPTSARDPHNYRLTGPQGRSVRVRSATYNATASTVTLRLASRLDGRSSYQLQVIGVAPAGVRAATGPFLAGAGQGLAGTNYQATITSSTAARTKAQALPVATTAAHPNARLAAQSRRVTRLALARPAP